MKTGDGWVMISAPIPPLLSEQIPEIETFSRLVRVTSNTKITVQYEKDVYKYQGAEINVLLIDELTHFTRFQYVYLLGRVRIPIELKIPDKFSSNLFFIFTLKSCPIELLIPITSQRICSKPSQAYVICVA